MWLGAGWAALCGAVASGGLDLRGANLVRLPALLLLTDGLLGAVWATLTIAADRLAETGRASTREIEPSGVRDLADGEGSLSEEAVDLAVLAPPLPIRAGQAISRLRRALLTMGEELLHWFIAVAATFAVAPLLGPVVTALAAAGVLFPLVVSFAFGGHPLRGGLTRAVVEVLVPWSLGLAAFTALPNIGQGVADWVAAMVLWVADHGTHFLVAGLFSAAYYALLTLDRRTRRRWRIIGLNLSQGLIVALLVLWRQPLLAGMAAFLWFAQLPFQPYLRMGYVRWYLHNTQWFVMGWMLVASVAIALK